MAIWSLALLAELFLDRHLDVAERDRGRVGRALTHLVQVLLDDDTVEVGRKRRTPTGLRPLLLSVEAKTTSQSAWPALVMNIFEPLMTYSSPWRTAVVPIPETSEPASAP